MRYLFYFIFVIILLVCNIPFLILALLSAIWKWDIEPLKAFTDGVFDNKLVEYITKDWDV